VAAVAAGTAVKKLRRPSFTATDGQVAATRKGQGQPDQDKPTNTNGGHSTGIIFPEIKHILQAKKI